MDCNYKMGTPFSDLRNKIINKLDEIIIKTKTSNLSEEGKKNFIELQELYKTYINNCYTKLEENGKVGDALFFTGIEISLPINLLEFCKSEKTNNILSYDEFNKNKNKFNEFKNHYKDIKHVQCVFDEFDLMCIKLDQFSKDGKLSYEVKNFTFA